MRLPSEKRSRRDASDKTAAHWIQMLDLAPHPEGGYYRETYRSAENLPRNALPPRFTGARATSTAIYFLLRSEDVSRLHRLHADEVWHFYNGSAMTLHMIDGDGSYRPLKLGRRFGQGEHLQAIVAAGTWFGVTIEDPAGYALAGCTMAPGFDFEDFELGDRAALIEQFPQHRGLIQHLTT